MVDDVLEDGHPADVPGLRGQEGADAGQRLALHGGEGAAVHVVTGDAFGELRGDRVHGCAGLVDDIAHHLDPLGGEQHGPHLVPGVPGPSDDLLALGDEEAFGGLPTAPEFDVREAGVVTQTRVVGVVDGDELSHGTMLPHR